MSMIHIVTMSKLFKVIYKKKKKGHRCGSLDELRVKSKEKFDIDENVKFSIHMTDGTEIDQESIEFLQAETVLKIVLEEEVEEVQQEPTANLLMEIRELKMRVNELQLDMSLLHLGEAASFMCAEEFGPKTNQDDAEYIYFLEKLISNRHTEIHFAKNANIESVKRKYDDALTSIDELFQEGDRGVERLINVLIWIWLTS